jgi:uncharacterized protein (TIGR02594 family)
MAYKVVQTTDLLKAPDADSEVLTTLMEGEILADAGETKGAFVKVNHPAAAVPGWVAASDCQKIDDAPRPPVKEEDFVSSCVLAERAMNDEPTTAPWLVSADFIIARAIIETGIANVGPKIPGSDGVGPLQITVKEWNDFLNSPLGKSGGFDSNGRDEATVQTSGAAYRMFADAKAISDAKLAKGVGSAKDPFLPSYLDVFHAYLTNSAAAAVAILDALASDADKSKKLSDVLKGPLDDNQITAFFNARGQFTGKTADGKSVADFAAATETALNDALKKAFDLQVKYVPEEMPQISLGEAPWFDVAKAEEAKNISEANSNDTIVAYFNATDISPKPTSASTPWCGAFAAFCMKGAGPVAAASIPKGAAQAARWKGWGAGISWQSGEVPQGAVVVLSPTSETGGSGHVGFFVQFLQDGKKVELLGGNQSNKVTRTPFDASRIAAVRWLDLTPVTDAVEPAGPPSDTPISTAAINLIVHYEVGSEDDYRRIYHLPEWPQGASGVTIGIGYDVGYSTSAQLDADWGGKLAPAMISALKRAVGVTGSRAGPLAKELRGSVDVPYEQAMAVFGQRDIPKWVGIVQRALPNTDKLSQDCLGVLVSLAFNRGASFSKSGDRYNEMRAIKECMTKNPPDLAGIPPQLRSMKRLWPNLRGLRERRDAEAQLFETGRTKPPGS